MIKTWEVMLLILVGAFLGMTVGFLFGHSTSDADVPVTGDALVGAVIGGAFGTGVGLLVGHALRRAKPRP